MKKLISMLSLAALSLAASASYDQAPPSFAFRDSKAVFVDFQSADYDITYDVESQTATVESTITFLSKERGYPVVDLVATPSEIILDDVDAESEVTQDPERSSNMRVLLNEVSRGRHVLHMKHTLTTNVVFKDNAVASGFWTSDLTDRRYLEQYLPANLEYDQVPMNLHVKVIGSETSHVLKANGKVQKISDNEFEVNFPKFYTTSSMYFHLFPEKSFVNNVQFYFKSIDGRMIPVDIYTSYDVQPFVDKAKAVLTELESDYGPFPHEQVVIYGNAPSGGMEYSGATITSLSALGHELFHSYHARCLMPANGNAGWMDEAIARWRDNSYPLTARLSYESTRLAGRSVWTRMTDRMAYTEGSAFLSWVAFRMNEKNLSFKKFLRDYFQKYKYTTVTTQLFQSEMTEASGLPLSVDFDKYIYGKGSSLKSLSKIHLKEDPMHPHFTDQQLQDLTWIK